MTISVSQAHNDFRLVGTRAFLDSGAGNGYVEVYEGTQPATHDDPATGSTLLMTITLDKPSGALVAHQLALSASLVAFVVATGTPQWARYYNGDGVVGGDCTASGLGGSGVVQVETTVGGQVLAGGAVAVVSAVLG